MIFILSILDPIVCVLCFSLATLLMYKYGLREWSETPKDIILILIPSILILTVPSLVLWATGAELTLETYNAYTPTATGVSIWVVMLMISRLVKKRKGTAS